mgnify:CR=1 FL=1
MTAAEVLVTPQLSRLKKGEDNSKLEQNNSSKTLFHQYGLKQ